MTTQEQRARRATRLMRGNIPNSPLVFFGCTLSEEQAQRARLLNVRRTSDPSMPTSYADMRFGKDVDEMDVHDVRDAIATLEEDFRMAEECGQGISTKETATMRALRLRLFDLDEVTP